MEKFMVRGVYPLLDHRQWLGRTAVKNKGADLQLDGDSDWTLPIFDGISVLPEWLSDLQDGFLRLP
jgi:hypothetical protein